MGPGDVFIDELRVLKRSDWIIILPKSFEHDRIELIVVLAMVGQELVPDNAPELGRDSFQNGDFQLLRLPNECVCLQSKLLVSDQRQKLICPLLQVVVLCFCEVFLIRPRLMLNILDFFWHCLTSTKANHLLMMNIRKSFVSSYES